MIEVSRLTAVSRQNLPYPDSSNGSGSDPVADREAAIRGALIESRLRFKDIAELCGDFCWETDAEGRFVYVSTTGPLGFSTDDLLGRSALGFLDPDAPERNGSPFLTDRSVAGVDVWMRSADGGGAVCFETSARPVFSSDGDRIATRGVCRDVSEERRRARSLARSLERERQIAHIVRAVRDEFDPDRMLDIAITTTTRSLGAAGGRLYRRDSTGGWIEAAHHGDFSLDGEFFDPALARLSNTGASGDLRPFEVEYPEGTGLVVATSWRHAVNGAVAVWKPLRQGEWSTTDIAFLDEIAVNLGVALQQFAHRAELEALSRTDGLTGLLNRRAFETDLGNRLGHGDAGGALFYVDLDNFKPVNDVHGHQKGDEALVAVADMLTGCCRPGDLVARFGGDEFALWLERTDEDGARARAVDMLDSSKILRRFSGAPDRPLGISVGIAVRPRGARETLADMTLRADAAMYDIKHNGKAGYVIAPDSADSAEEGQ